jgi:hypothetical protein
MLTLPVARYNHLSRDDIYREMDASNRAFYSLRRILSRAVGSVRGKRKPIFTVVANLSNRNNMRLYRKVFREFAASQDAPRLEHHRRECGVVAAANGSNTQMS